MRIETTKGDFVDMVQSVIDAVPAKGTLPVLQTILMVVEDGKCELSATDLEMSITTSRPLEAVEEGRATFPARKMFDIIRELPEGPITVSETDGRVTLKSANGEYSMLSVPASDFPAIPTEIEGVKINVDGDLLRRMVGKVAFAVHPDPMRATLNGLCWQVEPNSMTMIATDGHRLAKINEAVEAEIEQAIEVIVPPLVMQEAIKLVREENALKTVTIGQRQIHFSYDRVEMFARLIEGAYADVSSVIPKDNDKFLMVNVEDLIPAVRRMLILSSQQNHQIKLALKEDSMEVSTVNRETGAEARETVTAEYGSDQMEIGYNAEYLHEVLARMDCATVRFQFREPVSAAIIEPAEQAEGEGYFCLLMPLRIMDQ